MGTNAQLETGATERGPQLSNPSGALSGYADACAAFSIYKSEVPIDGGIAIMTVQARDVRMCR